MSHRLFNDAQEAEIAQGYRSGKSMARLAAEYRTNPVTMRNALKRQGCERRRGGPSRIWLSDEVGADAEQRYLAGETQSMIAAALGHSQPIIGRYLRAKGLTRPRASYRAGHGNWKGGRVKIGAYTAVLMELDDPLYGMMGVTGYVLEHRLVMARKLGRPLRADETVHHRDGDGTNNAEDNLQLRQGRHGTGTAHQCLDCGSFNIATVNLD